MMLPRSLLVLALCLGAARAAHAQAPAPTANDGLASRAVDGNTDGGTKRFGGSSSRGPSFVALAAHGAPP